MPCGHSSAVKDPDPACAASLIQMGFEVGEFCWSVNGLFHCAGRSVPESDTFGRVTDLKETMGSGIYLALRTCHLGFTLILES